MAGEAARDARMAEVARAGEIRSALFLPQYSLAADGSLVGHGTGYMGIEMTRVIGERLGIAGRVLGFPTPPSVVEGLETGACDLAFMGIEPGRAARLAFSPAIFEFDYTFLTPAGSSIARVADADRADVRVALVRGHASALALEKIVSRCAFVDAELPDEGFAALREGRADCFACPRDVLLDYAEKLPGSRVLDDAFGVNRVGIAMAKGRGDLLAWITDFVEEAKRAGDVAAAITRGALRGFRVAT